jgi:glycosyltransferase involved in cell wall biosynthesis
MHPYPSFFIHKTMDADIFSSDRQITQDRTQVSLTEKTTGRSTLHKRAPGKVYFNGRFLTAVPAGVHRVAEEMIVAVDKLLAEEPALAAAFDLTLATPRNIRHMPRLKQVQNKTGGSFSGILWEQLNLPRLTSDGLCIGFCNAGPLARRNAMTMLHDTQVYSMPASYSFAFRLWYRISLPLIGRRHKHILTGTAAAKSDLVRYGVAPAEKISIIPHGCDHILRIAPDDTAIARLGLQNQPYVLSLANTQFHKNIGILLKAFADPALKHATLALFGGATAADFEATGQKAPDNVVFLGRISDAELVGLMKGATAYACPSLTEGFGLPPLEAMLHGCPAIVACDALVEVCEDAALTADPHDATAWTGQISRLMTDDALRNDMRAKGKRQAGKYTWQRAARQLLRTVAEVENIPVPKELRL